jgi:hypothetical protein
MLLRSAELVGWALGGLEREISQTRDRLASLTAQAAKLRARLGRGGKNVKAAVAAEAPPVPARKPRQMSAAARKRISDNMKKRWAETKKKGLRRL